MFELASHETYHKKEEKDDLHKTYTEKSEVKFKHHLSYCCY